MSKDRQTIFLFASAGFGVPVVWLGYQMLMDPSPWSAFNDFLPVMVLILCPPSVLTIPLMDVEIGAKYTSLVWAVVVALNAAGWARIGSAVVGARERRMGSSTT
jgi:hypothetical protein